MRITLNEDWLAVVAGFILIASVYWGLVRLVPW